MTSPFGPVDPDQYTSLMDAGRILFTMFRSYVDAGFTEDQAMRLLLHNITINKSGTGKE